MQSRENKLIKVINEKESEIEGYKAGNISNSINNNIIVK